MIEFYVTTTGNYDPQHIDNPSSAFILDYKNKTLEVMGQYGFDFQRIDASYLQLRDAGLRGLSIAGANNLFHDVIRRSEDIAQRYVALPNASIGYVSSSIGRLDASVNALENTIQEFDGSVGYIKHLISSIDEHLNKTDASVAEVAASVAGVDGSINLLERNMAVANASINTLSAAIGTSLEPINASISRLNTSVGLNSSSISRLNSSVSALEIGLSDSDASIVNIKENYIRKALIGRPSGVASLDESGHVPASQLPSYVDDIVEGYKYRGVFYEDSTHQHQIVPEGSKIYVDLNTGKTYRWGGTEYVIVSDSIAIGETDGTAFEGSRGVALEDAFFEHATDTSIHVSETDRESWEDAADRAHDHENKSILDGISQDEIDNWDDASAKRHIHENKALLDAISDASVIAWKNVNPDWTATGGDASILHRPNLGEAALSNVFVGSLSNTTVSNSLVTATQVAEYGQTKMTASQVASAIDASIKALILDNYTTEDEVAAIVDSSIKALHLEIYATNASVLAAIDASISALNVDQYMTENETAAAINSSITALNISQYATKTLMYSAIDASIAALNVSQYTTDAEVAAIVSSSLNAWIPNASIAEYNNAASKAHTHSNAAILDGIKDASIAQWLKDTSYGTGTVLELNAGTSIVPEVWDASTLAAYFAQESANSVRFCGDFNASTGEISGPEPIQTLNQISEKIGDMYVASAVGTYLGVDMQIGDSIIFRNAVAKNTDVEVTDVTFVQGAVKVIAKNPTLSWDSSVKIGNVEGVDLYVKTMPMPSKSDIGLGDIDTRVENVSAGLISLNAYALDTSNRLAQVDINLSGRIADVSADLISLGTQTSEKFDALDLVDTTLSGRIADVSAEVISLSAYAGEVSANIVTVNTNLSGRIADVSADLSELATAVSDLSTYAHSVDPDVANRIADVSAEVIALTLYASEVSSNLATVSTRVTDVSADVVSLTGYAENVSSRLDSTNTALLSLINDLSTRFNDLSSNVNIKTHTVDASVQELFDNTAEIETTWAGAWEQLFNDNSTLIR